MPSTGPDYTISGNKLTLRDVPAAGEVIIVEYFPAGPSPKPKKAGDVQPAKYAALSSFASTTQQVMTSLNATAWTARSSPTDSNGGLGATIAFGAGKFVALCLDSSGSTWIAITSSDGITWASHSTIQPNNQWQVMIWHSGLGLFVGLDLGNSSAGAKVITSSDGVSWTLATTIPGGQVAGFLNLAVSGSGLVAVQDDHTSDHKDVLTSPDAVAWTPQLMPGTHQDWGGVCAGNSILVAVANSGNGDQAATSSDGGVTWVRQTTPTHTPGNQWLSVVFGSGLFVAVGQPASGSGGSIMTSPDGVTWTLRTAPGSCGGSNQVIYDGTQFIAACFGPGNNTIITSPDGITWTQQTGAISDTVLGVTFSA